MISLAFIKFWDKFLSISIILESRLKVNLCKCKLVVSRDIISLILFVTLDKSKLKLIFFASFSFLNTLFKRNIIIDYVPLFEEQAVRWYARD